MMFFGYFFVSKIYIASHSGWGCGAWCHREDYSQSHECDYQNTMWLVLFHAFHTYFIVHFRLSTCD